MLATIILDRFRQSEVNDVARAMDRFCQPGDTHIFSSSLVYCFSDPTTRTILYIGLTTNIGLRFRQHTGLIECDPDCCKLEKLNEYFKTREKIGFSIFVQSAMLHPGMDADLRQKLDMSDEAFDIIRDDLLDHEENVAFAEGFLIKLYEKLGDFKPEWNAIHGAKHAHDALAPNPFTMKARTMENLIRTRHEPDSGAPENFEEHVKAEGRYFDILENLEGSHRSYLNAKCTIRELANSFDFMRFEDFLHGTRMLMLSHGMTQDDAFAIQVRGLPDAKELIEEMTEDGYLERVAPLE